MGLPRFLLLALLAGNVLLRLFTNSLNILPRVFNLWDLALTAALVGVALTFLPISAPPVPASKWVGRLLAFNCICFLGSLLNMTYIYPLAALSQLVMWNEPILLFLAVVCLPFSLTDINKFRRVLLFLVGLEIAIGLLQVPVFLKTGDSETIIGTFHGNAEQYQFFVLIGFFYLLAQLEFGFGKANARILGIFLILVLVLLIDNKASWLALAGSLVILLPKLHKFRGQVLGKIRRYALLVTILFCGYQTVKLTSATYSNKFGNVVEAVRSGNLMNVGKVKGLRDVLNAYWSSPEMAFVGSGMGTFYSRASFQFFGFTSRVAYQFIPPGTGHYKGSASMAGVIKPVVDREAFYTRFFNYEKIYPIGSGTIDLPNSSYISLLGETGVLGTLLYMGFYFLVLRKLGEALKLSSSDALFFPFVAATFASLLYLMLMGCYNDWLDSGRVNTIVWAMSALSLRYALLKRRAMQEIVESNSQLGEVCEQFAVGGRASVRHA